MDLKYICYAAYFCFSLINSLSPPETPEATKDVYIYSDQSIEIKLVFLKSDISV